MKFLCVLCDQPMKLMQVAPPDRGTLSVVYECPECAHRIALLTNPLETQMVTSLGVQIGPGGETTESKCPFSAMTRRRLRCPARSSRGASFTITKTSTSRTKRSW